MTTIWIYVDTRYHPGHPDHLRVFANPVAADEWFKENDFMKYPGWGGSLTQSPCEVIQTLHAPPRSGRPLFLGLHFEPERIQMPQVVISPGNSFFAK